MTLTSGAIVNKLVLTTPQRCHAFVSWLLESVLGKTYLGLPGITVIIGYATSYSFSRYFCFYLIKLITFILEIHYAMLFNRSDQLN